MRRSAPTAIHAGHANHSLGAGPPDPRQAAYTGRFLRALGAAAGVAVVLGLSAGCTSNNNPATPAPNSGARPRSTATLTIVQPTAGAVLSGTTVHVQLGLTGGRVVPETSTNLKPDLGHIHLSVDGKVISMLYGVVQDVPVAKGTHLLTAEYVAQDHFPFNPRVIRSVTFAVR